MSSKKSQKQAYRGHHEQIKSFGRLYVLVKIACSCCLTFVLFQKLSHFISHQEVSAQTGREVLGVENVLIANQFQILCRDSFRNTVYILLTC